MTANIANFVSCYRGKVDFLPQGFDVVLGMCRDLSNNKADLKKIVAEYDKSQDWSETPEKFIPAIKSFGKLGQVWSIDQFISALRSCHNFKPINFINATNDAEEDIKKISEHESVSSFGVYTDDLFIQFYLKVVMYDPYEDLNFDFGKFRITMSKNHHYPFAEPISDNTSFQGLFHPYVKGGSICMGQYENGYIAAMSEMRFYDAFDLVYRNLTLYGGDELNTTANGPHSALLNWIGVRCVICDAAHKLEETMPCFVTNQKICPDCSTNKVNIDEVSGEACIPQSLDDCDKCEKRTVKVRTQEDGSKICTTCRMK